MLLLLLASSSVDWNFDKYTEPLPEQFVSASVCADCHQEQYQQWKDSRHALAWNNDLMQAGYIMEPETFCALCHAPYAEQLAEIQANESWYHAQHPTKGSLLNIPDKKAEPLAAEGITCAACHLRGGTILSSNDVALAAHPTQSTPFLKSSEFCKDCHDFPILEIHNEKIDVSTTPMQTTYTEWKDWTQQGGKESCQDCHMPNGSHHFYGANHRPSLKDSIQIHRESDDQKTIFTIESIGVGHNLPSGDILRRITLQIQRDQHWEIIHTMGKNFVIQMEDGLPRKRLQSNSSLQPGIPQRISVSAPQNTPWRVVYHYASAEDELRAMVSYDQLIYILAAGP